MKTKHFLACSLLLNLLLLGGATWQQFASVRAQPGSPASETQQPTRPPAPPPVPDAAPPAPAAPPFLWSQVESPDYPTYIANLRSIACPEVTIRDIITADVGELYRKKREEAQTLAHAGGLTALLLEDRLRQINLEESQLLLTLLGAKGGGIRPGIASDGRISKTYPPRAGASAPPVSSNPETAQQNVSVPLLLVAPPSSKPLDPDQQEIMKSLVKEFVASIGGPNQDPNNPEYLRKWQQAQDNFDNLLRVKLGDAVYRERLQYTQQLLFKQQLLLDQQSAASASQSGTPP